MKTLETRRLVAQLKILPNPIDNTKQVRKVPVRQVCTDIKFKPLFGIIESYPLSFFPQVVRLWKGPPKDITNIKNKTNFSKKVEIFPRMNS